MAKVRLLNDGGFDGMKTVELPVVVEAKIVTKNSSMVALVGYQELKMAGYDLSFIDEGDTRAFFMGDECELVED